jgi:DNA-directed RNA polymerase specialized sigma24 family protein
MSTHDRILGETALVEACLAGDRAAREQFAEEYDGVLRHFIRGRLGGLPDKYEVADDLANRVWLCLAEKDYSPLRCFDPAEATLADYMQQLGQREICRYYWRRRHWRKKGEVCLPDVDKVDRTDRYLALALERAEFLATLSPPHRAFVENYLLRRPQEGESCPYSPDQIWKLRHRLFKQAIAFLSVEPPRS